MQWLPRAGRALCTLQHTLSSAAVPDASALRATGSAGRKRRQTVLDPVHERLALERFDCRWEMSSRLPEVCWEQANNKKGTA